jgi:hypothetical protein
MSTKIQAAPVAAAVAEPVTIRPNVEITPAMTAEIDKIAMGYALGNENVYTNMGTYTININNFARSLGLSYGQFFDELREAMFRLEDKITFDKSAAAKLIMGL